MTTITIDQKLYFSKTHFSTLKDVMEFFSKFCDEEWVMETQKNKKAYQASLLWKNEKYSLSDLEKLCDA